MTGFYGADTEALRSLAGRFREGGQRIEEIRDALAPAVLDAGSWTGPDADAFRASWSSAVQPRLGSVIGEVTRRDPDLVREADEQDTVSEDDGGKSFWDILREVGTVAAKAFGVYEAMSKIVSDIKDMRRLWRAYRLGPEDFARVWESLKLRNRMIWASEGFGKLMSTVSGYIPGLPAVWEWAGKQIDKLPLKLHEGAGLLRTIAEKLGPETLATIGKASKVLGKVVPFVDIGVGIYQMTQAEDGYGFTSGLLSTAGGALMLAGIAFPPLAVVGGILSGASLVMDLVDMGGELFGIDPSKAVSDFVGDAASHVGDAISDGVGFVQDAVGNLGRSLGSIFG